MSPWGPRLNGVIQRPFGQLQQLASLSTIGTCGEAQGKPGYLVLVGKKVLFTISLSQASMVLGASTKSEISTILSRVRTMAIERQMA